MNLNGAARRSKHRDGVIQRKRGTVQESSRRREETLSRRTPSATWTDWTIFQHQYGLAGATVQSYPLLFLPEPTWISTSDAGRSPSFSDFQREHHPTLYTASSIHIPARIKHQHLPHF
ncbi:hypothetical protein PM082_004558 [Marasmius tenuissimus]|nr:hypothetical protein PM082_004558 [Marasmius tenuissimus]